MFYIFFCFSNILPHFHARVAIRLKRTSTLTNSTRCATCNDEAFGVSI
jgi:hypothetical protein